MTTAPRRLYTLGPAGTFSDRAAQRLRAHLAAQGAAAPEVCYTRTIPEVLDRTEADGEARGVFPIENSDTGTVLFAQDSLLEHALTLEWEVSVRVRFNLLANAPLGQVRTVYSQPVAYDQCGFFLAEHMPQATVSFTNSNTASGEAFLEAQDGAPCAAIVPDDYGAADAGAVAATDIQNYEHNTTRFLVARAAAGAPPLDFGRAKCSIFIDPEEDRPGLLYDLLSVFKQHELNLCRLESRPARVRPWTYVFFLDFDNNARTPAALDALREQGGRLVVLGSYDLLP